MTFPAHWTRITISAIYEDNEGNPLTGSVRFDGSPVVQVALDGVIVKPLSITATLDATGSISVLIPSTDDPDISPIDWSWRVTECVPGKLRNPYYIDVPYNGGPLNLSSVPHVVPLTPYVIDATQLRADLAASSGATLIGWIRNAVNAVKCWVSDKLAETVTPDDFFTPGDTDYGSACTKALAYLITVGGGVLSFPQKSGGYNIPSGVLQGTSSGTIRFRGNASTLNHTGSGNLFTIKGGGSPSGPKHIIEGFICYAVTPNTGTGVYIEDCGSQKVVDCNFYDFQYGNVVDNATSFSEHNIFDNVRCRGGTGAWRIVNSGSSAHSMATTTWVACSASSAQVNGSTPANWIGLYLGTNTTIYRGQAKGLTLFTDTNNAIGCYCDGGVLSAQLALNIENSTSGVATGTIGYQFGPNCDGWDRCEIGGDIRGVDTPYDFSLAAAGVSIKVRQLNSANGAATVLRTSVVQNLERYVDNAAVVLRQMKRTTANNWEHQTDNLLKFTDTSGVIRNVQGIFTGTGTVTATNNATTYSLTGLGSPLQIRFTNSGATNFTNFTNAVAGQVINVVCTEANTTFKQGTTLKLPGGVDLASAAGLCFSMMWDGVAGAWQMMGGIKT